MTITPSNLQNNAISAIANWYKNGSKPFFYLGGVAGTGKTSIAKFAVEACGLDPNNSRQVLYGSFTGKAAMVMQRKGLNAKTIHQLIYTLIEKKNGELFFGINKQSEVRFAKLVVLDECSMINDQIATDLLSLGTKILVLGDPAQLEPVKGTGYFTKNTPDFFLDEIHRQALDSPIIRISMDVRAGKEMQFGDNKDVRKLSFDDLSDIELLDSDQVVTGMHTTRHLLNTYMLEVEGFNVGYPLMAGIKMLCLRNYKDTGLINGSIGRTMNTLNASQIDYDKRFLIQRVLIEDGPYDHQQKTSEIRMNLGAFEDNWSPRSDNDKANDDFLIDRGFNNRHSRPELIQHQFDFGYAITVHKSQGSQYDDLIVFDDKMMIWNRQARKRWLYTAVTRAAKTLTIVE